MLTLTEVTNVLKISRTTFWRIKKRLDIPVTYIGSRPRFKQKDIEKLIKDKTV